MYAIRSYYVDQAHDERAADALAVEVAALDLQVVEHRDVVRRIRVPAVLRRDRRARLAAGVALVHHDHAIVRRKFRHRVDGRGRRTPHGDRGLHARRRKREDRESFAVLLVSYNFV